MARPIAKIARKYYKHDFKIMIALEMERLASLEKQKEITPELEAKIFTIKGLVREFRLCERKMLNYLWCQKSMDRALEVKGKIKEFWDTNKGSFAPEVQAEIATVEEKENEVKGNLWIKVDKDAGNSFTEKAKEENPELNPPKLPEEEDLPEEDTEELPPAPEPQGKTYQVIFEHGEQATFEDEVQPWSKKEKKVGEGITLEDLPAFPKVKVTDEEHYQVSAETPWSTWSANVKEKDCTEEQIRQMNIKDNLCIRPNVVGK